MYWGAWAATALFTVLWAVIAAGNASILRAQLRRKEGEHSPSFVPFIGGIFAVIAAAACPWHSPWIAVALTAALLLDIGSAPYVVLILVATVTGAAAGAWQIGLLGLMARAPRALQLGLGFLVWMGVWIGGGILAGRMGWELQWPLMAFMILFWPLYITFLWRLRKYRAPSSG